MQQLYPDHAALALDATYADIALAGNPGDPKISLGMVASVDGASSVGGLTADLGGDADDVAFRRLRDAADAILVGAGTVRDEQYRAPNPSSDRRERRRSQGLAEAPTLVVVTRSLGIQRDAPVFAGEVAPVIITTERAAARRGDLASCADIVTLGIDDVALNDISRVLGDRGLGRILCEGGPQLNAALLRADCVDELFLTVAPLLVGGEAGRIVTSADGETPTPMALVSVYEHESELLLRYRRK